MTRVSGYSDDLVYVECNSVATEIPYKPNKKIEIEFEDGTVIGIDYGGRAATWRIDVLVRGTAAATLEMCAAHDETVYSDSFTIDSKLRSIL